MEVNYGPQTPLIFYVINEVKANNNQMQIQVFPVLQWVNILIKSRFLNRAISLLFVHLWCKVKNISYYHHTRIYLDDSFFITNQFMLYGKG